MIRDICAENGNIASKTSIYNMALTKQIDEYTVDSIIQDLRRSGVLFEPKKDNFSFV